MNPNKFPRTLNRMALGMVTLSLGVMTGFAQIVYSTHSDGSVWQNVAALPCNGSSCTGWAQVNNDPNTASISPGAGGSLYQVDTGGAVWADYGSATCNGESCTGWTEIDWVPCTKITLGGHTSCILLPLAPQPVAVAVGQGVFELRSDGSVWQFVPNTLGFAQPADESWIQLDNNPKGKAIAAFSGESGGLYELRSDGSVWQYTFEACSNGVCSGWRELDNNSATIAISTPFSLSNVLYQLRNDGSIWQVNQNDCYITCVWTEIGNNTITTSIATDATTGTLYALDSSGSVWQYQNVPCTTSTSCTGWVQIDRYPCKPSIHLPGGGEACIPEIGAPKVVSIAAADNTPMELKTDGSIWIYQSATIGWVQIDNNPANKTIAVGSLIFH
jgi:hypothetical protein